jgi:hypothetical protein
MYEMEQTKASPILLYPHPPTTPWQQRSVPPVQKPLPGTGTCPNTCKQIGYDNTYSHDIPTASELAFVIVYKGILELLEHNLRNSIYTFDAHFTQLCILLTFTIQSGYRQNDLH